jgi:excisionase family DNA binding protein
MTERPVRRFQAQSADTASPPGTIEALVEAAVERAVSRLLEPHLHRLQPCSPAVYTISQAAAVLQVSDDTIGRLVRKGVLPRVPHLDGKVLIPREAVARMIEGGQGPRSVAGPHISGRSPGREAS